MTSGLEMAVRFALSPLNEGACGRKESVDILQSFLATRSNQDLVRQELLKHFKTLTPNLSAIAKLNGMENPFDDQVVEAYLFGNELLENKSSQDFSILEEELLKVGIPEFRVTELKKALPKKLLQLHLWFVLLTSLSEPSIIGYDMHKEVGNCMVSWGQVKSLQKNKALLSMAMLKGTKNGTELFEGSATLSFDSKMIPNLKIGDNVAIHRRNIFMVISEEQKSRLQKYTQRVLDIYNS